jgi:glutamate synthase domain-containing protein 3
MARQCHLNTCPTGIATQREDLRAKFMGTTDMVINYFRFLAMETRELLAALGARSLDEVIGRVDLLQQRATDDARLRRLDLKALITMPHRTGDYALKREQTRNDPPFKDPFPEQLVADAEAALERKERTTLVYPIANRNRTVGARLAYEVSRRYGAEALPDGTLEVQLKGAAGQSFGAFLTRGIRLVLDGEANDYVGKGLNGGEIVLRPTAEARFAAHENIIMGNTILYGATGGHLFAAGRAGERFAVRNSGAVAVIEGAGDHCCEYMTGGIVVVLGPVGRNFAAGMSAGTAFVLDEAGDFPGKVNPELVGLQRVCENGQVLDADGEQSLRSLVERHVEATGSLRGRDVLEHWAEYLPRFWKVVPDPPDLQTHTPAMAGADSGSPP